MQFGWIFAHYLTFFLKNDGLSSKNYFERLETEQQLR
jgi:hypothetical protein